MLAREESLLTDTLIVRSPEEPSRPEYQGQAVATAQTQPSPATGAGWPVEARFAAWVIMSAGAIFRICKWVHWRSLWLDELYIVHNILTRGFWQLLSQPLRYWQTAPAGFLVVERFCVDIANLLFARAGGGERVLRLPSLIAGLASLPLFYGVTRRVLPARAGLMALLIFATLSPLIYYSQETKQYSLDVAVTLGILLTSLNIWEYGVSGRRLIWYAAVGGIGVYFSFPAVFVLAGTGLALLIGGVSQARRRGESIWQWMGGLLAVAAVTGGLEFLNFWYFIRPTVKNRNQMLGLMQYWLRPENNGFLARGPHEILPWLWKAFWRLVHDPDTMNINGADLGLMMAIIGVGALFMNGRRMKLWLILSPLPFALAASAAHLYPFAERLILYLTPMMALLMAAGLDWVWGDRSMGRALVAMLALVILTGAAVFGDMDEIYQRNGREETEPVYTWIRARWQPGDLLFLSNSSAPSFDYYAPKSGPSGLTQLWADGVFDLPTQLEGTRNGEESNPGYNKAYDPHPNKAAPPDVQGYVYVQRDASSLPIAFHSPEERNAEYLSEVDDVCHPPASWHWPAIKRIWVVYAHSWDGMGFPVDSICLPEFERQAVRVGELHEEGAAVYLYQVEDKPHS